ncbi:uncharacterized protein LOC113496078 [Trichoplusia ni]|uniref:Uncharacterized protein LOC113496078 n=1 Tax=Trichoplusia ni TaxID=7111 RepID=A0A7E5VRR5_TRINI|nr:uncharacterized protein LOC113496078 [Trichoplusia ni]
MNGISRVSIVLLVYVFLVKCERIRPQVSSYTSEADSEWDRKTGRVPATVFRTVNKFYCSIDSIVEGSHLIVYGTKGWTFNEQDVNLTLSYPPVRDEMSLPPVEEYIITGFRVYLYSDGDDIQGFIIDGGVLQEKIMLSFVTSRVTSLKYMFWVYGARKDISGIDLNNQYRLCT